MVHGQNSARVPQIGEIPHSREDPAPLSWKQLASMVAEQTQAKLNTIAEYERRLSQVDQNSVEQTTKFTQVSDIDLIHKHTSFLIEHKSLINLNLSSTVSNKSHKQM